MTVTSNRTHSGLADAVAAILRCVTCEGRLEDRGTELVCVDCGRKYPQVNSVIRFVGEQQYAGSFGFQWQVHARTQLDSKESHRSEQSFRQRTGFTPEDLAGKLVLDVGCGMGRFADIATRWGAHVVGIDLSLAAEVAACNLAGREATIFQADVFHLPFAPESFDFIYSIGVLHHTPNCEQAFKMLPRLLKPGGRIAIWLYSRYNAWYRMSDIYRKVTRRMPIRMLHALCYGVVPLYGIHQVLKRIPLVGRAASGALAYMVPMAFHPDRTWRILDTFDWYSPWYQSKHTYEEVFRWFESCGLENLRVIDQPIAVQGQRPVLAEFSNSGLSTSEMKGDQPVCGIAGVIGKPGEVIDSEDVHRMCQTIIHRGPDDEGIHRQGAVGLGMRRLSIIDVAGGQQPIHNEDNTVWVVFNGEIYNFQELRRELEGRGHHFYTHSDTEVIVHLYEEMGAECLKKLRGMFAIALYDQKRNSLLLARDRLGKKPLHYALHDGRLLFGSEIKTILALHPELAEVDAEGILQYFYFGYIPDPRTAFQHIRKLPPGHWMEYRNGEVKIQQYWDLPEYGTHPPLSEEECLTEMERRLDEAVRVRLISEVPLGALLSGGLDSSIIVALMARASGKPIKTFSIGFGEEKFNESGYARMVAERFDTDHHELVVDPNIEETLQYLSGMMEEPFGDSSMLPTYYVCRMARREVTVALSGDGGDELFAGYDRYLVAMQRRKFDPFRRYVGPIYRERIHGLLPAGMYGKNLAWNASLNERDRYLDGISFFPVLHRERDLFSQEFLQRAQGLPDPLADWRQIYNNAPAHDRLSRLLYLDTKTYLSADILTKVDRMSMATSLEVRAPMLDHEFVEWVTALPVEWKFRNGTRKYILKKLAERLEIPPALLHRRKQGFQLPLVDWMRDRTKAQFWSVLQEPRTLQRGYFKTEGVRSLLDEHLRGRRNRSGMLWRMLVLELWHRNFMDGRSDWAGGRLAPEVIAGEVSSLTESTAGASLRPGVAAN